MHSHPSKFRSTASVVFSPAGEFIARGRNKQYPSLLFPNKTHLAYFYARQISGQHQATLYLALGRRSSFHGAEHRFNGGIAHSLDAHLIYLAFVQANMQDACLKRLRRDGTAGEEVSMIARNRRNGLGQDRKIVL